MALKKTIAVNGVTINDAYIRVSKYSGTKTQVNLTVDICANPDAKPIQQQEIQTGINPSGANVLTQAYNHIKTIPCFINAEDC
jgi:hypothetical protein